MPHHRSLLGIVFVIAALFALQEVSYAQVVQDSLVRDNRGKEFYLTFMPNIHNRPDALEDSLYIFISADEQTNVTINYHSMINAGTENVFRDYTQEFTVNANQVYTFSLPYKQQFFNLPTEYFELPGFRENRDALVDIISVNEDIVPLSFHIEADEEIAVYGLNRARTTSDAFMALPVDILGTNYFILSYNSHDHQILETTPSQFAIVATEDDTEVEFTPSAPTFKNGMDRQVIQLNEGDVYLVHADLVDAVSTGQARDGVGNDFSGTNIISDKPIAVFAGHQRALIPWLGIERFNSRDHLVQQMMPLSTWGTQAIIVPFLDSPDEHRENSDLFRIVAALDGTNITIDGTQTIVLNAGEVFEGEIGREAFLIDADAPIMVAEYRHSLSIRQPRPEDQELLQADPFMLLIPPVEQFLDEYLTINAQSSQALITNRFVNELVYETQYITLVMPTAFQNSIIVEPQPLTPYNWVPVPGTEYSYTTVRVSDGVHQIAADTTVGVYVYGYGAADSYGYPGGVRFEKIFGPVIDADDVCSNLTGFVADTTSFDKPIILVDVPEERKLNVDVRFDPPDTPRDTVVFEAQLLNPYEDGEFYILAKDALRLEVEGLYRLPGFTVHVDATIRDESTVEEIDSVRTGRTKCYTATLQNYGRFPQKIDALRFRSASPEFVLDPNGPQFPLELEPGASLEIGFCFEADFVGEFNDTLEIVGDCIPRPLITVNFVTGADEQDPTITGAEDVCLDPFSLAIADRHAFSAGIETIDIRQQVNTEISLDEGGLPEEAAIDIRVLDRRTDAIYEVAVTDSAGNVGLFLDTIPGFTLDITAPQDGFLDFGNLALGSISCTEITVQNFGLRPLNFDLLQMLGNVNFSLPYSQYPIVLAPGELRELTLCFHPQTAGDLMDTLLFPFNCISIPLRMAGVSIPPRFSGVANCDFVLTGVISGDGSSGIRAGLVSGAYPNPSGDRSIIDIALEQHQYVTLRIVHMSGREVLRSRQFLPPGQISIELDLNDMPQGMYYCQIQSQDVNHVESLIISR